MEQVHPVGSVERGRLFGALRLVRWRWRLRQALFGAAVMVALGFALLAVASVALDALRYGSGAVFAFRAVCGVGIAALIARFLVLPLRARLPDERVALYVEEREPTLDASVLTAVELERGAPAAGVPPRSGARSPALGRRLLATALERMAAVHDGRGVDARALTRNATLLASVLAIVAAAIGFGPAVLRHGVRLLLTPWDATQPLSLYDIRVLPGDTAIARGGDQLVTAELRGFRAAGAQLLVRPADSSAFVPLSMLADNDSTRFTFRLLGVRAPVEYAVVANGVRSRVYRLRVADLPFVKQLALEYRFPAYTGLAPRKVIDGGDIAAPRGTLVTVHVTPTQATGGGRLVLDGGDTLRLVPASDGTLIGVVRVARPGFYKAQLQAPDGRMLDASLDYNIDVLPDRPPTVSFTKPGADTRVLSVDEVYLQVRAEDDYGIRHVDLAYSVNGGPERTLPVFDARTARMPEISAGYTLPLEGLKLQPGDVVSYYARATDNDAVDGAHSTTSDIYFLEVRPYEQDYRQDQSGGGGGGGQQNSPGRLTQTQRDIIAGTFKTERDRAATDPSELAGNVATLRLAQQKLREQVQQLAQRLVQRGIADQDTNYRRIAEILPRAAVDMDSAERRLAESDPRGALAPEQRALQQLQHAEAVFRNVRVSMGGGGGGGGLSQQRAQDLADLFEMNRDKLRNQYETLNRGGDGGAQPSGADRIDSTLEKLSRLAQRQQQENERAARKLDSMSLGAPGASGGAGQRDLARQAEETARQLERLAREQSSPQMADAARRLQDAANDMRRAAAERSGQSGAAGGAGANALRRLDDARRLLDEQRTAGLERDVGEALDRARALQRDQQQAGADVAKLGDGSTGADQAARAALRQRKSDMASRMNDIERRLDKSAEDAKRLGSAAATKLDEAAQAARDRGIADRLRASASQLRWVNPQYARANEDRIAGDLGDVVQRIQSAAGSVRERQQAAGQGSPGSQRIAQALDRTRELVRGLETMQQQQPSGSGGGAARGLRERMSDAQRLRSELAREGVDVAPLDRAIARMGAMADDRLGADSAAVAALRSQTLEDLKAFAFVLGRNVQGGERVLVGGGRDEVPAAYREAVERYYRSLAATRRK